MTRTPTAPTPLLGLVGRARSGKDTVASFLIAEAAFTRYAFADPLKAAALALDPLVGSPALPGDLAPLRGVRLSTAIDAIGWERAKDTIPEVRRTLQRLGSAMRDEVDEQTWTRATLDRVVEHVSSDAGPVVVTDVRYPNEADAIRLLGGRVVRVLRPSHHLPATGLHVSETALDDYEADAVIVNDADLDTLRARTLEVVTFA